MIITVSLLKSTFRILIKSVAGTHKTSFFGEETLIIDLNFILFEYLLLQHLDGSNLVIDLKVTGLGETNFEVVHVIEGSWISRLYI